MLSTGANSGLGYETVVALASSSIEHSKYHIILSSRSLEKGQRAREEIQSRLADGGNPSQTSISHLQLDVTDADSIARAKASVEQEFGRLDVLVNNAAILFGAVGIANKETLGINDTLTELRTTFETNVFGQLAVTETFLPLLMKSGNARVVYVSSDLGSITKFVETRFVQTSLSYRMSKAALNMLAMYHHVKYEGLAIKVGVFNPGYIVTGLGNPGMDVTAWKDFRKSRGANESMKSAIALVDVIQGKRDSDLAKGILDVEGDVLPW